MNDPIFDPALLSMCMTWRHDFGLLDRKEQMAIKRELLGLYEHHVKPTIDRAETAESSLAAMRQRAEEAEASLLLHAKADGRGILQWQKATGNELVWPDQGNLVEWALSDRDAAIARAERAEESLLRCQRLADDGVDDPAGPYNVLAQIANTVAAALSSPSADASRMGRDHISQPVKMVGERERRLAEALWAADSLADHAVAFCEECDGSCADCQFLGLTTLVGAYRTTREAIYLPKRGAGLEGEKQ